LVRPLSSLALNLFKSYYRRTYVPPPSHLEKREYGFQLFGVQGMLRHISFGNGNELNEFLRSRVPQHAYYSTALYESPSAPEMSGKGWLGAELVFDIDIDHVDTPCKELHDTWKCKNCGAEGRGQPRACPVCGSENLERKSWVCDICINSARDEALKLLDLLENDFGVSRNEVAITFSGHRGFHIHVQREDFMSLDQDARREISDYVRGLGLEPELMLRRSKGGLYAFRYDAETPGWPGRIARYAALLLSERIAGSGLPELPKAEWEDLIKTAVNELSAKIDEKVTIDVHRLIRLPGTLHGKTGLKVLELTASELEALTAEDILKKAIVFGDEEVRVRMRKLPSRVLLYTIESDSDVVNVPLHLALYLHLNGGAEVLR
jgi:DNA primase small subunit